MTAVTPLPRDANGQISAYANSAGAAAAIQLDGSGNLPIAVAGGTVLTSSSITRPANTTAYAAGEVVGTATSDILTFAKAARLAGDGGLVLDVLLIDQGGAAAATSLELYLFTASPVAAADQAALALSATDLSGLVAVVPLGSSFVTNTGAGTTGSRVYTAQSMPASSARRQVKHSMACSSCAQRTRPLPASSLPSC